MTPLPPPGITPDQLAASLYGGALLLTSAGTLITVIVGVIRGGKKLTSIETATNGTATAMTENAAAMTAEIKRLEVALAKSLEARLVAAENSRRAIVERAEDRDLQEKTDTGGRS